MSSCQTVQKQLGFTLMEIMMVVVIIGIAIGGVTLAVKGNSAAEYMDTETQRIVALVGLLREEAVTQGQEMSLSVEENKYYFEVFVEDHWQPIEGVRALRERKLKPGYRFELIADNIELKLAPASKEDEEQAGSLETADEKPPARIYVLSSGELMPFELVINAIDEGLEYRVKGNQLGELQRIKPDDDY